MPRNRIIRAQPDVDYGIGKLMKLTEAYEENASKRNSKFSWLTGWFDFVWKPNPPKIQELNILDRREFNFKKSAFYRRNPKTEDDCEERSESSASSSTESSRSSTNDEDEWTPEDAYQFLQNQLIWSRVWIILFSFIGAQTFGNLFLTDAFVGYDAVLEQKRRENTILEVSADLFAGLRRWDSQQFLFIIDNDYLFEKSLAFFPGYVITVKFFRSIVLTIFSIFGLFPGKWVVTPTLVVFLNCTFSYFAGVMLLFLAYQLTRNMKVSMLAVSLFAYNPASVFFVSAYSESLYSLVTFISILALTLACRQPNLPLKVVFLFFSLVFAAFSFMIRSNGIFNAGFNAWYACGSVIWETENPLPDSEVTDAQVVVIKNRNKREKLLTEWKTYEKARRSSRKEFRFGMEGKFGLVTFTTIVVFAVGLSLMIYPPFFIYGTAISDEFCSKSSQLATLARIFSRQNPKIAKNFVRAGDVEKMSWCLQDRNQSVFPPFYGAIQKKYWDVGLFEYWQVKKIPCFLLAAPAYYLTWLAIKFALKDIFVDKRWFNIYVLMGRCDNLFVYACHAAVLLFIGVFVSNAEIYTRLIFSSSPFLYVFLAKWLDGLTQGDVMGNRMFDFVNSNRFLPFYVFKQVWNSSWTAKLFYLYFIGYFVFGTIAHAAWLPFT